MKSISERLQWARTNHGKYKSPTDAARAFGWTVSTYLGHENGDRNPSRDMAKKYAKAYRVRWEWLLEGEGKPTGGKAKTTNAVGYVGAGAEILPFDGHSAGDLEEIDIPPGVPDDAVLVIVRGDSMYPRYFENEMLFYVRRMDDPREHVGRECVVALEDGRMLVKILRRSGAEGFFNLESWNAPLIEAVAIQWAAPVLARVNKNGQ